ncbi:NADP-dependent oxidoreductase [Nocardioides currus]|uniref:NADP-dependent oxidoreductase n=1 Tax=Nocardioides currus TaxID=2133958 RepID=A0A2R7Z3J3_9ACTN|nr:NADP-dependent oxidoreductase [Nocardioides currus]PUA82789.1 NADP-dependent oxidoreductase [Nocardioides currus]
MSVSSSSTTHRRFVLARRPQGLPVAADFEVVESGVPAARTGDVVVRHTHLGLAPAARIRMSEDVQGYLPPFAIGDTIYGAAVGLVVDSRHDDFTVGDVVVSINGGWQTHDVSDGSNLRPVDLDLAPAPTWLGVMGVSGLTAYVGLTDIGQVSAGDTVVVSAAAGAVGSTAVQFARAMGCRVVGVAGGPDKARHVLEVLGADACVDYKAPDLPRQLAAACPDGVDVYFDNVGGMVRDAVWPLMRQYGRIVVCGQIAEYNRADAVGSGPDWYPLLTRSLVVRGFLASRYQHRYDDFRARAAQWLQDGSVLPTEHVVPGFESTPEAFIGMLQGRNVGKTVVAI